MGWIHRRGAGPLGLTSLILLQSVVYWRGLHPGVAQGDSAELQWAAPLLGICHSPGYALQVTCGKVFSLLPIGESVAWRINLMSAVFGVIGCVALYSAVRRITHRVLPGWVAGAMLAFSSVYWSHSLIAEVYVFGAAFILLAIESTTRFIQTNRAVWLGLTSFFLGVAIAERPSEVLILPAFLGVWFCFRKQISMTPKRWLIAAGCLFIPFALAFGLNTLRSDPHRFTARDEVLRDTVVGYQPGEVTFDYTRPTGSISSTRSTLSFMLGLKWSPRLGLHGPGHQLIKYGWLLSGLGVWGERFVPEGEADEMLKGGVSLGLPGVLLALLGVMAWRRQPGWVLLGVGLFAGNLAFILVYEAWDNLTFTIPGLIGLSLLAGLGCAGPPDLPSTILHQPRWRIYGSACIVVSLILVPINFRFVDRNTPRERSNQEVLARVIALPLPERTVILSKYWPAMQLRYLYWIKADRQDISVIHAVRGTHIRLAAKFQKEGRPVFLTRGLLHKSVERELLINTPERFRSRGFIRLGDR